MSLVDENSKSWSLKDTVSSFGSAAVSAATDAAKTEGSKLINEGLGRVGIAVGNAGPGATRSLDAGRGVGTPSPEGQLPRSGGGFLGMFTGKWQWIAGAVAVGLVVYLVTKKKK